MSLARNAPALLPGGNIRSLLAKWIIALIVPLLVFTFWAGEAIINTVVSPATAPSAVPTDVGSLIQSALFAALVYLVVIALAGYVVATDSGHDRFWKTWLDVAIFVLVPLILIIFAGQFAGENALILGLALSVVVWGIYFLIRNLIQRRLPAASKPSKQDISPVADLPPSVVRQRAVLGSFWFAVALDVIWLVIDLAYFFSGQIGLTILIWVIVRTLLLPILGYAMGRFAGAYIMWRANRAVAAKGTNGTNGAKNGQKVAINANPGSSNGLARARARIMNDLPLRSAGAQRFMLTLLIVFLLFYPAIDPFLFGSGLDGRLSGYGDAGYYVILALGLNIVVGFAGLLDLGYVAFFAIGSYVWGFVGSSQFTVITGIQTNLHVVSWLFWPMLIVTALIAAFWGVLLGAPTLRLRGDYLAIVTLGFGEIVPVVFLEMDKYTNGSNGIVGVQPPAFPGANWNTSTPYYYLILALIVLVIFANIRLRDSRLGRAWVAIREDEIAAASSGVNLVNTKLFAFAAGAFFSGLAGMYHAAKLGVVSPDNFSFGDSVIYLAMVVIGGIGSIPGVIVGALVVYSLNEFLLPNLDAAMNTPSSVLYPFHQAITSVIPGFAFENIRNLIFGVLLIIIMLFRPEGLIPSARRRRELHREEQDEVEIGALDVSPGAPGFESEIHVE